MPEWRRLVRERLQGVNLPPADEIGIVEELAQHLEDRYRELCGAGRTHEEALSCSLEEIAGDLAEGFRGALDDDNDEPD